MILFLDDDPNRTKRFQSYAPAALCTETAAGMIDLLGRHRADFLFLDHDLGQETFVDSGRPDCGAEVVRWIVANRPNIGQIIVHSLNPDGAEWMVNALLECGYNASHIPFIYLPWDQISAVADSIR